MAKLDPQLLGTVVSLLTPQMETIEQREHWLATVFPSALLRPNINLEGTPSDATLNIVHALEAHGELSDGRQALWALLSAVADHLSPDKRQQIAELEWQINDTNGDERTRSYMPDSAWNPKHVFISYAHSDLPFVKRLIASLNDAGLSVWVDKAGLKVGTHNWETEIRNAIRDCYAFVVVASPNSRKSNYVSAELAIAEMYPCPIMPVWSSGTRWADTASMQIMMTQFVDLRAESYGINLPDLLTELRAASIKLPPTKRDVQPMEAVSAAQETTAIRNPYRGLRPFNAENAGDFFGRDQLIDHLLKWFGTADANARLLAVVGPSGSGKSSVVLAGLMPRLKKNALPGSENWIYPAPFVPSQYPIDNLAKAIAEVSEQPADVAMRHLGSASGLNDLTGMMSRSKDNRVVLVIDQFEELFTQTDDEDHRRRFIDLLVTAASEPGGRTTIILTLRADFYDRPMNYPALGKLIERGNVSVLPMLVPDLRAAIEEPAALPDVNLRLEEGLVGDLLYEVRGQAGALPLLQFTLDQLFQRRSGRTLTFDAYHSIGGVRGALARHAQAVYDGLPSFEHRDLAKSLFLRLIEPGSTEQDTTRRRASISELSLPDAHKTKLLHEVADTFVNERLLTKDRFSDVETIEVSHEALIREWKQLGEWLLNARADVKQQKAIALDAAEWISRGASDHDDTLYRGTVLIDAEAWAKRNTPSTSEQTFINASLAAQQRLIEREEQRTRELKESAERAERATRAAKEEAERAEQAQQAAKEAERAAKAEAERAEQAQQAATVATEQAAKSEDAARTATEESKRSTRRAILARRIALFIGAVAVVVGVFAGIFSLDATNRVTSANQTLEPIPSTLTPVAGILQQAQAQVAAAERDLTQANVQIATATVVQGTAIAQVTAAQLELVRAFGNSETQNAVVARLTQVAPTLGFADSRLSTATVAQGQALNSAATAAANIQTAENQAALALTQAAVVEQTLLPVPATLTPVAITLQAAQQQIATAQVSVDLANNQVATANIALDQAERESNIAGTQAAQAQMQVAQSGLTLTPIPLTLTPVGATLQAAASLIEEAQEQVEGFGLTLTPLPLTLTPVQATVQAGATQIAAANVELMNAGATLDLAVAQGATANFAAAAAQTNVAVVARTLTPIPLTLTPVGATLQAAAALIEEAQEQVEDFGLTLTPIPLTLTPVQATVQAGATQVAVANVELVNAGKAFDLAVAQGATANFEAAAAQTNVAIVAQTLTPIPLTLTPVGGTVQAANGLVATSAAQVGTAEAELVRAFGNAETQQAVVSQLTAIPPTLTPLSETLAVANVQILTATAALGAANQQAEQAEIYSAAVQTQAALTLAPVGATLTPVGATLAAGNTQVAQVREDAQTAVAEAGVALTPVQATLQAVNAQVEAAQIQATQLVAQVGEAESVALQSRLIARARALLASRDGSALAAALLSIRVLRGGHSVDAESTLIEAVERNNARALYESELSTLIGASFSPDGRRFVMAGDNTALVWDVFTGERLLELSAHRAPITSVDYSVDGTLILTASEDGRAILWDAERGEILRQYVGHDSVVNAAAISDNNQYIATAGDDGRIILWRSDSERQERTLFVENEYANLERRIVDVTFDSSLRIVASIDLIGNADQRNLLAVWTTTGNQTSGSLGGTGELFTSVVAGVGAIITTNGTESASVRSGNGSRIEFDLIGHTRAVTSAVYRNDLILTASEDETAILWNATTGERIQTFAGHGEPLTYAVLSPDSRFVLTIGVEGTAVLWDREAGDSFTSTAVEATNLELGALGSISQPVAAAYSPNGQYLAVGSRSDVVIYDLTTGTQILDLNAPGGAPDLLRFSQDGTLLTAISSRGFSSWNIPDGEQRVAITGGQRVFRGVSADGRFVAAYNTQPTEAVVYLYSTQTGQEVRRYPGHSARLRDAEMSPTGLLMISGGDDTTAVLWDTQISGRQVFQFGHRNRLQQTEFSRTGAYAFTLDVQSYGYIWNIANNGRLSEFADISAAEFSRDDSMVAVDIGAVVEIYSLPFMQVVRSLPTNESPVDFSPDNRLALTCSADRGCTIWDIESGSPVAELRDTMPPIFSPDSRSYAYSTGDSIFVGTTPSGDVAVQRLAEANREGIRQIEVPTTDSAAYNPDGSLIAISSDERITLHDARTGREIRSLDTVSSGTSRISSLQFSPDGRYLTGFKVSRNVVVVWDVQSGGEALVLDPRGNSLNLSPGGAAAWRPDGQMMVTGGIRSTSSNFYEVLEWNTATGVLVSIMADHRAPVTDVVYNPDGTRIASVDEGGILDIWDAGTDQRLLRIEAHQGSANAVVFSPDGTRIVTAGDDDRAIVWDVATGAQVLSLQAHVAGVTDVAFSADGQYIVTVGRDSFAYVWEASSGIQVRMPLLHDGILNAIAFKPDGRQFAVTGQMPTVRIWDVDYHDFVAYACGLLVRDLTTSERERFDLDDDIPACDPQPEASEAVISPEIEPAADPSGVATPTPTPSLQTMIVSATGNVNIREGPGSTFNPVAVVAPNTVVSVLGFNDDNTWVNVRLADGLEGWIAITLLR